MAKITENERPEKGDLVAYIGGGRFGIVSFGARLSPAKNDFTIKKIIEWENKDKKTEWRSVVCEHYSVV
jgi:hypothetical protein